jgi:transposase InsO family protein
VLHRPVELAQFTSWTFTERARKAGLLPSLGSVGDPYDNAVVESFWGRMQTELLDRQRWDTRLHLANAIFEYIEGFHNRRRRSLGVPGLLHDVVERPLRRASATHLWGCRARRR